MPPADDPVTGLALAAIDAAAVSDHLLTPPDGRRRLAPSVIYAFARDPEFAGAADVAARLADDPAALDILRGIVRRTGAAVMPRQAAASSGTTRERRTGGATLRMTPSRTRPGHIYVSIELTDATARPPRLLIAVGGDGTCARDLLPPFTDGIAQAVYEASSDMIALLSDPGAEVLLA